MMLTINHITYGFLGFPCHMAISVSVSICITIYSGRIFYYSLCTVLSFLFIHWVAGHGGQWCKSVLYINIAKIFFLSFIIQSSIRMKLIFPSSVKHLENSEGLEKDDDDRLHELCV